MGVRTALAAGAAAAAAAGWAADARAAPTAAECARTHAARTLAPRIAADPRPRAPRVFAMQFKHELRHVETIAAFRTVIECRIRELVLPHRARGRANIVAFNEDIGLMTMAAGGRGALARLAFGGPGGLSCESLGVPCGAVGALGLITATYAPQLAAYRLRFPSMTLGLAQGFVATTDTMVRGFMETFSRLARKYGLYILGSNNQARFTESTAPADVALFAPAGARSAYVASDPRVYNTVFLWGPRDVRADGPRPLRNVVARNDKLPLTPIEELLSLTPGAATVENLRPYRVPGTRARLGFATSLPAFIYGDAVADPCADIARHYMRCLDKLGTNVVIQDEANPGRWTGGDGDGVSKWQPLSWMRSTYRATSDPSVRFLYNVTPHLVGNLADLAFDGQTAITQRGLRGGRCHYIGNSVFVPADDREEYRTYAGPQPGFLAIAPWVVPDGPRDALRAVGARLAPGSGDALENDYPDTAVIADLPIPVNPRRRGCRADGSPSPRPRPAATPSGAKARPPRQATR